MIYAPNGAEALEAVAAMDVLRLAMIPRKAYPADRDRLPAWLVVRAIFTDETETRRLFVDAVRSRAGNDRGLQGGDPEAPPARHARTVRLRR